MAELPEWTVVLLASGHVRTAMKAPTTASVAAAAVALVPIEEARGLMSAMREAYTAWLAGWRRMCASRVGSLTQPPQGHGT